MTRACFRLKQTIVKPKPYHSLQQHRMDIRNMVLKYYPCLHRYFNNKRGGIHKENLHCCQFCDCYTKKSHKSTKFSWPIPTFQMSGQLIFIEKRAR